MNRRAVCSAAASLFATAVFPTLLVGQGRRETGTTL
jgi:hypothetical protein